MIEKDWSGRFEVAQRRTGGYRAALAIVLILVAIAFLFSAIVTLDSPHYQWPHFDVATACIVLFVVAGWLIRSDWRRCKKKAPPE